MRINNNFNVLPFYDSLQKQNSKKWYSFGQHYPLICPNNTILPFQFITDSEVTVSSNIEAVNVHSGKVTNLGVKPSVSKGTQADATYYIVKMVETTISAMPEGLHYLRINTNKGYLYSEEFTYNVNHEECIKIEYWNENTLNFNSGEINFDDDFRFILYIPSTIGKPEYEFEEELTKRLGYKFIESQTSNKIYKFNFLAPEYICDAMRLIRLCDYIKLTTKFDTFNALSFAYEPKWQDNGDLAAVDVEFDTDCIIQKLESFNRRLKESFYNALLADIDEPVLFSNDIVAQYYTEFTTTSYINGKLIRQLEAINEAELGSLENLVLPIDNQSDTEQKAKKITLASLKNVLIKLADYVTLSSAQNINGEKNFIGGLKVNGSPIVYDAAKGYWKLQGNLVLTGGITMYADDGSVELPSLYDGLPIDGTTIYWETDEAGNRVLKAVGGGGTAESVAWSNITGKPSWIGSSKPTYTYSEIQSTPDLSLYAKKTDIPSLSGYATESWVNKQNYATKATTLSGYGITDAYTKTNVDDLLKAYVTLGGTQTITGAKNFTGGLKVNGSPIYYDTEKKYWKLEGDLLVTGGVTMYGSDSSFTPSTIMDALLYDDATLGINSNGQLYVKGGTSGGGLDITALQNYLTQNSYLNVTSADNRYLMLSGGRIVGKLQIQRTPSNIAFYNADNVLWGHIGFNAANNAVVWDRSGANEYEILHRGNYSQYALPLSGGTITGELFVSSTSNNRAKISLISAADVPNDLLFGTNGEYHWSITSRNIEEGRYIGLYNNKEGSNGWVFKANFDTRVLDFMNTPTVNGNTIWHSDNDGSGSGLDADLLDGKHLSEIIRYEGYSNKNANKADTPQTITYWAENGGYGSTYGTALNIQGAGSWNNRIAFRTDGKIDYYQGINTGDMSYIGQIAFTSSNVASATKLQTARTIWGQSFDGTGNVSGTLSSVSGIQFANHGSGAFYINAYGNFIASSNSDNYNWAVARYDGTACISVKASSGNVGVGTTNPSVKFHVKLSSGHVVAQFESASTTQCVLSYKKSNGIAWAEGVGIKDNGDSFGWWTTTGQKCVASLDTSGNFLVNGGITMYSDQRKKTIINHVELSLKQIAEAPLIEHYYNSDEKKTTHVGSIAQYWANMNDWFCKLDSEGYYTMEIQNAALASAISVARELDRYETKTDKAIKKLKKHIYELEEEIERLKAS